LEAVVLRQIDVQVEGVRSPVLVGGPPESEAAVVFVHGNAGSGRDWTGLMESVSTFARCVAPDMPGYGAADKPPDFDYTVEGFGRHLGGVLDQLKIRRAQLVLHDLGGPWGLNWAAGHSAAVASLTLLGIGVLPGYRWHRFARIFRTPVLGEILLKLTRRRDVARALRSGSRGPVPDAYLDAMTHSFRDPGTQRAMLRFYRATPDLGAVTVRDAQALRDVNPPTLVIWGEGDPYVQVHFAEVQRKYFPRAEIVVLPMSGHFPFVDDPDGVSDVLVPFLKKQSTSAGSTYAETLIG
jgi:pimeloyl-ACP methyl ester carboxylesterase